MLLKYKALASNNHTLSWFILVSILAGTPLNLLPLFPSIFDYHEK